MTYLAEAAGFHLIEVPAEEGYPSLLAAVWSPCQEQVGEMKLPKITLPAALDCVVSGEKLPLIVISHGYGGSLSSHHDTAELLADSGFVVVALNHPVDTGAGDLSHADTLAVLTERPNDIKRLIDYMLSAWPDHAKLDPQRVGFFGFSRGGYTGLVVAGGNPDITKAAAFCSTSYPKPSCEELRRKAMPARALVHDPRVRAIVIADPAFGPLFDRNALEEVSVPLDLWASELSGEDKTGGEVTLDFVSAIDRELPVEHDFHLVRGAGHFAFLPPCAPDLAKTSARICADRPGFDRTYFHENFNAAALAFFRGHLVKIAQP
jgi:predicted dienelactone hydrolase